MKNKAIIVPALAIVAIATITLYALHLGHNSAVLLSSFVSIGGAAGYSISKIPHKRP